MIVKGLINSNLGNSSYSVRIPTLDKVEAASLNNQSLRTAEVSSPLNCGSQYLSNDSVYIEFENRDSSKPVILGSSTLTSDSVSDYKFNSLVVNNKSSLSEDTTIGEVSPEEISCLKETKSNIKEQFNSLDKNFSTIDIFIGKITDTNDDNNESYVDLSDKYDQNAESTNDLEIRIGDKNDSSDETINGKLNNLATGIDNLTNKIGKIPENKTVSNIIEDLKSRLQVLIDKAPKQHVNPSAESYNPTIDPYSYQSSYTDTGTGDYSSGGSSGGYSGGYSGGGSATFVSSLSDLRSKFPPGAYWNHAPIEGNLSYNGVNNQDGVTYTPCPKHGNCGTSTQTCNGYAPYGSELAWQCYGYAFKCGYDMTGTDPSSWKSERSSDYLAYVKTGDIIRYKGHSVYVIGTNGSSITL